MTDLHVAITLAKAAGAAIMRAYGGEITHTMKSPDQELTAADLDANRIITEGLATTGYRIISEENDERTITGERMWVIDPLDGTRGFIKRTGDFCVMIGILEKREPVLGVVYVPVTDTLYYAQRGEGAWMDTQSGKRRLQVSDIHDTASMRIIISKEHFHERDAAFAQALGAGFVKRGSIGIKLGEIAAGNADLYYNSDGISVWDICAPHAILQEAGGQVYDLRGDPLSYGKERFTNGVIAANSHCKEQILIAAARSRI